MIFLVSMCCLLLRTHACFLTIEKINQQTNANIEINFFRMLGGVAGRHMSNRRRGSSPAIRFGADLEGISPSRYARRRRAVTTLDHKSCALIQTRLKLGDIMWVHLSIFVKIGIVYYHFLQSFFWNPLNSSYLFQSLNE